MGERLRVAVYGLAIGDAVGVPYEFKQRGSFRCAGMIGYGTHHQPAGTWSDDTSMTLATCASNLKRGFMRKSIHRLVKFLTVELLAAKQLEIKREKKMKGQTATVL